VGCDRGDLTRHLRRTDLLADLFAVQPDPLLAICVIMHMKLELPQILLQLLFIAKVDLIGNNSPGYRTVHRTAIHIQHAKRFGHLFGHCTFASTRRTVEGNPDVPHDSSTFPQIRRKQAACLLNCWYSIQTIEDRTQPATHRQRDSAIDITTVIRL